eukprot:g1870.t1
MPRDQTDHQVSESELEELRNKFHLLEGDRKAYYEMSMHTMKSNKALIAQLRVENKDLRRALASIQREHAAANKAGRTADEEEVDEMSREVNSLRKRHDQLRNLAKKRANMLEKARMKGLELELEATAPSEENNPTTRKIRMLENRLDKAMIKYNEAQSIRKTYEQIVKRLQEERVGFDNQLAAIERTLAAKQHDYEELLLLSGDANHAKEVSLGELERVRNTYQEAKHIRERDLRERREMVQVKADMAQRMEDREKLRQDMINRASGDMSSSSMPHAPAAASPSAMGAEKGGANASSSAGDSEAHKAKIDVYEGAFRKIKEATGVSDVNEVIQKIVSQEDTQNNLMELTKENQSKLEELNDATDALKAHVEELKYSGPGGGHRRKMVDDHEENLGAAATKLERARLKYERLAKIMINVKAGIEHLSEKIMPLRDDEKAIQVNDETIVEVMYQCEATLVNALSRSDNAADGAAGSTSIADAIAGGISDSVVMQTRPFNQRIALPNADDLTSVEEGNHEELAEDMAEEEELTRLTIKKASEQLASANDRKQKRGQRKGGRRPPKHRM